MREERDGEKVCVWGGSLRKRDTASTTSIAPSHNEELRGSFEVMMFYNGAKKKCFVTLVRYLDIYFILLFIYLFISRFN